MPGTPLLCININGKYMQMLANFFSNTTLLLWNAYPGKVCRIHICWLAVCQLSLSAHPHPHTHTHTHAYAYARTHAFWRPRKISSACPTVSFHLPQFRSLVLCCRSIGPNNTEKPIPVHLHEQSPELQAGIFRINTERTIGKLAPICIDRDATMPPQTSHLQNAISMCERLFQHVRNDDLFSLKRVCASLVELMRWESGEHRVQGRKCAAFDNRFLAAASNAIIVHVYSQRMHVTRTRCASGALLIRHGLERRAIEWEKNV